MVKRPADHEAYPVSLEITDDFGWWTVSNVDTEQAGYGSCQIHWYLGNQLAKSEQYSFFVNKALAAGSTQPPEAAEQWYDDFVRTIGSLESLQTEDKTSIVAAINELLEKLNGIEAEANKYVHPTHEAHAAGFYKVTVDAEGHVTAVAAVEKADITALGIPGQDTQYEAATSEADGLMSKEDKAKLDGMVIATDAEVTEMLNEVFSATN